MVTHGKKSWALTSLGPWRDRSLQQTKKPNDFVKSKQREARRAMLLGGCVSHASFLRANRSTVDTADPPSLGKDGSVVTQLGVLLEPPGESSGSVDGAKSNAVHATDVADMTVEDADP